MSFSLNYGIYTIKYHDTIQKIASRLQPPVDWRELVTINNLEYPYIVPPDYQREGYAQGTVVLTRKPGVEDSITIPRNTEVVGRVDEIEVTYFTQEEVSIPEVGSVEVTLKASGYGSTYNIPPFTVLLFSDRLLNERVAISNPQPFSGGFYRKVRKWGETIYVPISAESNQPMAVDLIRAYGVDIGTDDQKISIGTKSDLSLAAGVSNLIQALSRLITTKKGSYILHPFYGSNLHHYIGEPISSELLALITAEVKDTLLQDVRVKSVDNVHIDVYRDQVMISCQITTRTDLVFPLQVVIDPTSKGGGLRGNLQARL
jgi:phage baseplate assembly protein W